MMNSWFAAPAVPVEVLQRQAQGEKVPVVTGPLGQKRLERPRLTYMPPTMHNPGPGRGIYGDIGND